MIDTHCHLYLNQFDKDRDSVIKQAINAGVRKMLAPAIDQSTSKVTCELSKAYPGSVYAAVGIHPNYSGEFNGNSFDEIFTKYGDQITAIGEIGLDYYRDHATKKEQIFVFERMLSLANEKRLPICLHNRDSQDDMLTILDNWYPKGTAHFSPAGVFHAYDGSAKISDWAIAHGFLLGIGGMITYKRNSQLREIVFDIGLNHIIVETDSPYLAPVPHRGRRNLPEYISIIIQELASIFRISTKEVSQATDNNAKQLFGFK